MNKLINKLKNLSPDSSELLKKGGSAFIIRLLGFGAGYVFLLMVTNWYGAKANGLLSLSITFIMLITIISRLGMDTSLVKYTAKYKRDNPNKIKFLYLKSIKVTAVISVLFSITLFIFANYISSTFFKSNIFGYSLKIISLGIPLWSIVQINASVLRGLKLTNWYAFYFQFGRFFLACILIILLYFSFNKSNNLYIPVWSYLSGIVIMSISSSFHVYRIFKTTIITNDLSKGNILNFKSYVNESLPMMFSASLMFLMGWLSTIILGLYESENNVGIFNVALKLGTLSTFVLTAIDSIAAPKYAELYHSNNFDRFKRLVCNSTRMIFIASFPILLTLFLFPEFVLSIFGDEFILGKTSLLLLLIGRFFNSITGSVANLLLMTGFQIVFRNILIYSLILNILLCFGLIPIFGINGAAIATSISMIFWNILSMIAVKRRLGVLTIKFLMPFKRP